MSVAPPKPLAHHEKLIPRAESAARQLINSWLFHGPKQANKLDPDTMPGILANVGNGVLEAMHTHGAKDFAGVFAYFTDAPGTLRDELIECSQGFAPLPENCAPLIEILTEYHKTRSLDFLAHKLSETIARGDDPTNVLREIVEFEKNQAKGNSSLRERAYAMRFDPNETPPPDETCMMIGDIPIAARGNLTVIQGKSKVGKSAVVSAVIAAAHRGQYQAAGDTLCIEWLGDSNGAIIHLDTEQSRSDWHGLVSRSIGRSGVEISPRLVSLPLVMFARSERLEILRQALEHEKASRGGIDALVIDGIADLCASPNDEAEALELVSRIMAMSQEFTAPIFCILHENPGTDSAKTRGHLGSELNRKAFANLRIDKDGETAISTIYGTDMRKREIPKDQGFCFAWDQEAGMHTFQGRAAGLKAAQKESEAVAKARSEWEPIFDFMASSGTNGACPAVSPKEAAEAERDIAGTKNLTKIETMKKRMQRAESIGVLRKIKDGVYSLNPSGQSGQMRDTENHSQP